MPEHKDLTGTDLHEPKGAATATHGQLYFADGLGSGTWEDNLHSVHGEMLIQANVTPEVTPTAVDPTLATDTDYTKIITGWSAGHADGITFNVDELVVPVDGDYFITAWADVLIPANNQKVAIKYAVNDVAPFSLRKMTCTSAAAGDVANISAGGFVALSATDTLSLYIATTAAGDPTVLESGLVMFLVHET